MFFLEANHNLNQFNFSITIRKSICNTTFQSNKLPNPITTASYFSRSNNTKYLIPPQSLKNQSTISNIIPKGFASIKAL